MIIILRDKPGGYTQVIVSDAMIDKGHVEFKLTSPTHVEVRDERAIDRDDWDDLPEVERVAIAVWNQGSADTTQMIKAVRAAINVERRRAYEAESPDVPMSPKLEVTEEDVAELVRKFEQAYPWFAKLRAKMRQEEHAWDSRVIDTAETTLAQLRQEGRDGEPIQEGERRRTGGPIAYGRSYGKVCMIPGCGCDGTPHP